MNDDLKDVIEAANGPRVIILADDDAAFKETVVDEVEEISEARIEETATQANATVENSNALHNGMATIVAFSNSIESSQTGNISNFFSSTEMKTPMYSVTKDNREQIMWPALKLALFPKLRKVEF